MNALRRWRQRFGIQIGVAAAVLGISVELLGRIECGDVEPTAELAVRIHIVTGGEVPPSTWASVRLRLVDGGLRLAPIAARQPGGSFGVNLYLGGELIARYDPSSAIELAAQLREIAGLCLSPPDPQPVIPWPGELAPPSSLPTAEAVQ